MLENKIEDFTVNNCPICGGSHIVKIDVYRDILPNDINKDIRVPEMKQLELNIICPENNEAFPMNLMFQEDVYSKVVKLRKVEDLY